MSYQYPFSLNNINRERFKEVISKFWNKFHLFFLGIPVNQFFTLFKNSDHNFTGVKTSFLGEKWHSEQLKEPLSFQKRKVFHPQRKLREEDRRRNRRCLLFKKVLFQRVFFELLS